MLATLGERLAAAPDQQITIVGTNANAGNEAGNTALSRQRAEAVKEYLVSNWGIAPERRQALGLPTSENAFRAWAAFAAAWYPGTAHRSRFQS